MEQVPSANPVSLQAHDILFRLSGTLSLMGFYYSMDAVVLCAEQPDRLLMVTKCVYPMVAKKHNTSWLAVERSIRTFVSVVWRTNPELLIELAERPINTRPTPQQFLAIVSNAIKQGRVAWIVQLFPVDELYFIFVKSCCNLLDPVFDLSGLQWLQTIVSCEENRERWAFDVWSPYAHKRHLFKSRLHHQSKQVKPVFDSSEYRNWKIWPHLRQRRFWRQAARLPSFFRWWNFFENARSSSFHLILTAFFFLRYT